MATITKKKTKSKVDEILSKLPTPKIDFLNIDLEGMDEQIISEFDFHKYRQHLERKQQFQCL
jgi:hypothetical protein